MMTADPGLDFASLVTLANALSPSFLSSAEAGQRQEAERLNQGSSLTAGNVFDLIDSTNPIEKYSIEWSKPANRDFIRRLNLLAQYGGSLQKDGGENWACRLLKFPNHIEEVSFVGDTPENAIDKAQANIRHAETKMVLAQDGVPQPTEYIKMPIKVSRPDVLSQVALSLGGLVTGLVLGWVLFALPAILHH